MNYSDVENSVFYDIGPIGSQVGNFRYRISNIATFRGPVLNGDDVCTLSGPAFEEPMEFPTFATAKEYVEENKEEIYKNLPKADRNPIP